jgi:general L-amino acid transport system permease protein
VLFFDLPRKLLIFTGLYPFIAFWLIWGGSIWTPLWVAVFLVISYLIFESYQKRSFAIACFAALAALFVFFMNPIGWVLSGLGTIVSLFVQGDVNVDVSFFLGGKRFALSEALPLLGHVSGGFQSIVPVSIEAVPSRDLGGFMLNMMLGVTCVSLSLPLGIALALGRQSSMPFIRYICVIFIEFIRGVPLITLLFVASVMLSYFFPPGSGVDLFIRVVIMITMFSSAYIAEVIRGGLAALPKGQYEAADSLGLDYAQAMRLIILPQALKISIPGIVNVAVGLFKDTTLVSVISMFDMIGMIRGPIVASTDWNGIYWELFGFAALLFFVVCYGISQYSQWLERRLATDHR